MLHEQLPCNREKLGELMLYIAQESEDDPRFGTTKLCKILYYSDFEAYRELGQPITGASYFKMERGPVPLVMYDVREELESSGVARVVKDDHNPFAPQRLEVSESRPSYGGNLSPGELRIVDDVIQRLKDDNATSVSDASHREPGWIATPDNEIIPYETAWVSPGPSSPKMMEFVRSLEIVED
ncbi:MAG: DUF4065 domain-containing protein [Chloroflexota bacterium]|nr:DUF4065 domain-containing protein [Chloroflexota bacterium]